MCSYGLSCLISSQPSYSTKKGCSEKLSEDTTKLQTTSQNQNYALISKDHHNMFKKGTHIACTSQDKLPAGQCPSHLLPPLLHSRNKGNQAQ
jgi:hypothetical protein